MTRMARMLLLAVSAFAFAFGTIVVPGAPLDGGAVVDEPPGAPLRVLAARRGFGIGAAVGARLLSDATYAATLAREFSLVTPENELKFGPIHPQPSRYAFGNADRIVEFARSNGLAVRGHTLVWHRQLPAWLTGRTWSRDQLVSVLREHIQTVVGRYRGRIACWDVINEAVDDRGALRDTFWLRGLGPEYLELAFRWVHEADPEARLFYNDYGSEGLGPKSDAVYKLVRDLREKGVPIHGIGLQCHFTLGVVPRLPDVAANMARLATLGLEVHVTELDVRIQQPATEAKLRSQAELYRSLCEACLGQPACKAFVLWGFTDRHSWIPSFFPGFGDALILDASYARKPAYYALSEVLAGVPPGSSGFLPLPSIHDVTLSRLYPPEKVAQLLVPPEAWRPFPRFADRLAWQSLPEGIRTRIVGLAEKAAEHSMPVLPASVYLDFARNGNRSRYEGIVNTRRSRLHALVLGECVEGKGRFLDPLVDTLWATFEESSWCIPAHIGAQKSGVGLPDVNEPIVDLFAAQTANSVVWTDYLLGEQLEQVSPLLRARLAGEVRRRILDPYRTRDDFGWMGLSPRSQRARPNNWNPWINSNVLAATLLLEREAAARVSQVSKVLRSLDAYLVPYPPDGSCDEGPGYWGVAGASLYDNLELLFSASNGAIDVFDRPVIAEIGRFIVRAHIAGDYFVAIGDNAARLQPDRGLVFRFGRRAGDASMQALAAAGAREADLDIVNRSLERALRNLFGWNELLNHRAAAAPLLRDVWLPSEDMQLMAARDRGGREAGLYLAAWGGHNAQSHNHNDVGNVLVFVDGRPAYTRQTFSSRRYEIWAMQSAYHNLPTVKGIQQSEGRRFAAHDVTYASDDAGAELRMDIAPAYPAAAGLASWVRRARLDRGKQITIEETVAFAGEPGEIVLNFVTPCEVDLGTPGRIVFRLTGVAPGQAKRALLEYDSGRFTASVERIALDDAGLERVWEGRLERIQLRMTRPAAKTGWTLRISSLAR